ncbi:MAG: hypothetical protein UT33_C0007G0069 [Candidatus Peregrinibacteria bacterium GW2011_GWC2_39_14]|nr:MAG: hypothetical protein US92_C0002G0070 [Candidatus Peregrinibacteria bacterium GW2011_GWA2_38_36]KKR06881.1 MAG: hypothetical protein UT33_C0007G0069 [Candidatus Peregrinibacteria bacterium GW2011_GWC2_39_14]
MEIKAFRHFVQQVTPPIILRKFADVFAGLEKFCRPTSDAVRNALADGGVFVDEVALSDIAPVAFDASDVVIEKDPAGLDEDADDCSLDGGLTIAEITAFELSGLSVVHEEVDSALAWASKFGWKGEKNRVLVFLAQNIGKFFQDREVNELVGGVSDLDDVVSEILRDYRYKNSPYAIQKRIVKGRPDATGDVDVRYVYRLTLRHLG